MAIVYAVLFIHRWGCPNARWVFIACIVPSMAYTLFLHRVLTSLA